jgi:hypothetical protein
MTTIKRFLSVALCGGLCLFAITSATVAQPAKAKAAKPAGARKPATGLVVQGKVKAIARTPRPGSVPYKDAVTAIHLTNVKPAQGKLKQSAILVYVWGMRNNKLTPAASYKVGKTVRFSLQPWDKVEVKYGRYQRMELDDDAVLELDAFWGEPAK